LLIRFPLSKIDGLLVAEFESISAEMKQIVQRENSEAFFHTLLTHGDDGTHCSISEYINIMHQINDSYLQEYDTMDLILRSIGQSIVAENVSSYSTIWKTRPFVCSNILQHINKIG